MDSGDLQHLASAPAVAVLWLPPSVRVACDHISVFFHDKKYNIW